MDLDPTLIARALLTTTALAWLLATSVRIRQWQRRHVELDAHRPPRMGAGTLMKTYAVANFGTWLPHAVFVTGAAAIIVPAILWPYAPYLVAALLLWHGLVGWRTLPDDDHITRLRQALADTMGTPPDQDPPTVHPSQDQHPHGGPLRLTIHPRRGWKYYGKEAQPSVARAVNGTMPGDWDLKSWAESGISIWERRAVLPPHAPYPRNLNQPWNQLPTGVHGHGQRIDVDLLVLPHVLIAGPSGWGKTTLFRDWAVHLLAHIPSLGGRTEALDVQGIGLAFLIGRPHTNTAMNWEACEHAVDRIYTDVMNRETKRVANLDTVFPPLIIFIDELARLFDRARENQETAKGRDARLITQLADIADTGRKVNVHLLLAMTRPDTSIIPGKMRDQLGWRIAVGKMSPDGLKMVLGDEYDKELKADDVRGRAIVAGAGFVGKVQLFHVPDPRDPLESDAARHDAERMLPPQDTPPEGQEGATDATGESPATLSRGARLATGSDATMTATLAPPAPPTEDPRERALRLKREGARRRRAELKVALGDPEHPKHGTPDAVNIGCRCPKVSPCPLVVEAADG